MYVYEVNLTIEKEVFRENETWLIEHFRDMVNKSKFIQAKVFAVKCINPIDDDHLRYEQLVVQYYISDYRILCRYLEEQASTMRSQVTERLGHHYMVNRRIYKLIETFRHQEEIL